LHRKRIIKIITSIAGANLITLAKTLPPIPPTLDLFN
jgi:hypothetical protein